MTTLHEAAKKVRKRPRQVRSQATVEAILEATAHILAGQGYEALTTNAVAARAGVSIGSLYQYFPSKEALVGELMDRHCDRMNALFGEVFLRAQDLAPPALARAVVAAIYQAKRENPELSRVLREHLPRLGRASRLEESLAQITHVVAGYLRRHKASLRVPSPERAAFYAVELGEGLTMASVLKDRHCDPQLAIDEVTDVVVRYLFA
jgi:AcrR family transcriptional regulator